MHNRTQQTQILRHRRLKCNHGDAVFFNLAIEFIDFPILKNDQIRRVQFAIEERLPCKLARDLYQCAHPKDIVLNPLELAIEVDANGFRVGNGRSSKDHGTKIALTARMTYQR